MKILVIVDMQNDFITGPLGNEACRAVAEPVCKFAEEAAAANSYDEIICTKDTHKKDYLQTQEGRRLPVEHCIEGTEGWELILGLKEKEVAFTTICKPTFGSMELAEHIRKITASVEEAEISVDFCGVCTGICVISNAMLIKAAVPEAHLTVFENLCACVTPESHKTALEAMKLCQIDIETKTAAV